MNGVIPGLIYCHHPGLNVEASSWPIRPVHNFLIQRMEVAIANLTSFMNCLAWYKRSFFETDANWSYNSCKLTTTRKSLPPPSIWLLIVPDDLGLAHTINLSCRGWRRHWWHWKQIQSFKGLSHWWPATKPPYHLTLFGCPVVGWRHIYGRKWQPAENDLTIQQLPNSCSWQHGIVKTWKPLIEKFSKGARGHTDWWCVIERSLSVLSWASTLWLVVCTFFYAICWPLNLPTWENYPEKKGRISNFLWLMFPLDFPSKLLPREYSHSYNSLLSKSSNYFSIWMIPERWRKYLALDWFELR